MLRRLLIVTVIAAAVSGIGAAVAAGANQTNNPSSPEATTTSTAVPQAPTQGLTQTISVSVRGGSLSVRPASVSVPLTWDAAHGRYRGHADIDVIDARGTLTGWTAKAAVQFGSGRLNVRPSKPMVIDGYDDGLSAGRKVEARNGDVVNLGSAAAGTGGGSFRIPVELELIGPRTSDAMTVMLVPQVSGA